MHPRIELILERGSLAKIFISTRPILCETPTQGYCFSRSFHPLATLPFMPREVEVPLALGVDGFLQDPHGDCLIYLKRNKGARSHVGFVIYVEILWNQLVLLHSHYVIFCATVRNIFSVAFLHLLNII